MSKVYAFKFSILFVIVLLPGCSSQKHANEMRLSDSLIDNRQARQTESDMRNAIANRTTQQSGIVLPPPSRDTLHQPILLPQKNDSQSTDWLRGGDIVTVKIKRLPLQMFADMLANVTAKNFIVESNMQNLLITASLDDLPWRDAVAMVARTHHFDVRQARRIIVFTALNRSPDNPAADKAVKQPLQTAASVASRRADLFRLAYIQPQALKEVLEPLFEGQKDQPMFSVDRRTRSLIVKAGPEDTQLIGALTKHLDQPVRQVEIEAFIVEANDDFERNLGMRLGFRTSDKDHIRLAGALDSDGLGVDLATINPNSGIEILFDRSRLRLELTALERQGKSRIVSNPKIFTLENQEAIIFQGDEVPYFTVSESGTQTEFKEAGIRLAVTPTIINEETLLLNITVNKDTVDTRVPNPPITRRQVSTKLKVSNGAVVVIGGIYLNTKVATIGEVPLFGKLPIIGRVFRQSEKNRDVRQLLVFIAPKISA